MRSRSTHHRGSALAHRSATLNGFAGRGVRQLWPLALLFLAVLVAVVNPAFADSATVKARTALTPRTLLFSRITGLDDSGEAPINAITQDQLGYIWYGTQEGLKRYDGIDVVTYEHRYDDPGSLANDWVWTVFVASDGTLWVGTDGGGLDRYERTRDSFRHYRHDPEDPTTLSSNRVRVVFEDRKGIFWIGTDGGGLNSLNPETGAITRFQHDPDLEGSLPDDRVLAVTEDRAGNLWVGTNGGGLSRLDRTSGRFSHFRHDPTVSTSLSDDQVRAIYEDRSGRLWVGTYEGGLNLFDPVSGAFRHFRHDPDNPASLSDDRVRDIYQDKDGALWVATDSGLNEWRPARGGFARYAHDPGDRSTLSDSRVTEIFQDRGGVLWVATYNGLNKWNYLSDAFVFYESKGTAIRLTSNIVTAVEETANGELWVGTYGGGLNRVNLAAGTVRYYRSADGDSGGLPNDRVMALHVDEQQQVWVATRAGGLSRLDPASDEFTHYRHDPRDPSSLSSNDVTSILAAGDGKLWVGTYGSGLNLLDGRSGQAVRFRHRAGDENSIGGDHVLALYRDRRDVLWVGTERGGLNRFDASNQTFTRFRHDPDNPSSLSADSAWAILESADGSLWVGTNGGGLNRWAPADRALGRARFTRFSKLDGLPSDAIQALLEDDSGLIWLSTNRGLVSLDPESGATRQFSRSSGLKGSEFNFGARLRSRSGRLVFGGSTGLVAFHPNQIMTNLHQPEIVLEAFSREGSLGTRFSVAQDDRQLELSYLDDLVTFEFAGLDFSAPDKNRYRYKLEGFESDWSETGEFRRATYTNLPAGDYVFRVQAANNDGIWNRAGVSMHLRVIPPPWLSPLAYAVYALLVVGAIAIYVRAQSRKLRRETAQRFELEQQVAARTEELAKRNDQLISLNQQIKESSWTDSLTGLKNRRFLDEFIEQEVALALRRAQEMDVSQGTQETLDAAPALAFVMIDLDGFKAINDHYGHHAGDRALVQVRDILLTCSRKSDTVVRWGGDEFLIVARNTSNRSAESLAERIRSELAEHRFQVTDEVVARLSASIGFAVYPFSPLRPEIASWEQVSKIADQCAYLAKQNGRDAWVGIYGNRDTTAEDVRSLAGDLERVLESGAVGLRTSIYRPLLLSGDRALETS